MSKLCQKILTKDHLNDKNKNRIKCIVLLSIIFPLLIVFITFITQEKELIGRLLKLDRSEIAQKVDEVMEVLKFEIQKSKIPLKYRKKHQKVNSRQENNRNLQKKKQTNLIKQIDHLKLTPLKYFTLSQVNAFQGDLQNKTYSLLIQDHSHIDLVKQIEEIRLSHDQLDLQKKKNPLQIYDKIIFKVVLMNINNDQMPIQQQSIRIMENQHLKNIKRRSYLRNMLRQLNQINLQDELKRPSIGIKLRGGHLFQLDQNYQSKMRSFFNARKKMLILEETEEKTNQQLNEFEYYMEDMIKQLQDSNTKSQCEYFRSHTQCKQYLIFVLYQSNQDFNQLVHSTNQVNKSSDILSEKTQQKSLEYWMKEDKSVTLINFHPKHIDSPSYDRKQSIQANDLLKMPSLGFLSTLEELFYEKLNIAPLFLLSLSQTKSQKIHINQNQTQLFVNQFINLNRMYKYQQILQQISLILENQNIPYKNIDQSQQNQLVKILQTIQHSLHLENKNQNKTMHQNLLDISVINYLNEIDPFPSDYKLGALLPIVIILIYPLIGYLKFLFD